MKIMIFGLPGSGKSTFALKLSKKLNLPLYHIDKYFYTANWIEKDFDEFMEIQKKMVNEENWIIDGNNLQSLEFRYSKADIAIYFKFSKLAALFGIIKRIFVPKDINIKDRAPGCKENVSWKLVKYLLTFESKIKDLIDYLPKKYPAVKFYVVKNRKEADMLLNVI